MRVISNDYRCKATKSSRYEITEENNNAIDGRLLGASAVALARGGFELRAIGRFFYLEIKTIIL